MMQDFTWAELGSRIRDKRISRRLSQQDLATSATITQAGLARIEIGATNPQLETLRRIAASLGVSVRFLLTGAAERHASTLNQRIARVLQSGDSEAIATIASAVRTAETLLRRNGNIVADTEASRRRTSTKADQTRRNELIAALGWNLPDNVEHSVNSPPRSKQRARIRTTDQKQLPPALMTLKSSSRGE